MDLKKGTDGKVPVDPVQTTAGAINQLKKFLDEYKSKEKGKFTHTWMGYPKASYDIPQDKLPQLFNLLYNRMFVENKEAHLTEKPCNPSNIKIDLDFRYDIDINHRQHNSKLIQEIVQLYNQVITEYLEISATQLNAYVFERRCGYKLKGYTRDGVHIMYPDIVAPVEAQHAIRKRVLELCEHIFTKLPLKNPNDDVIDRGVIGDNNWLVYGCTKPNLPRYKLISILDHQLEQIPITNDHLTLMIHLSNFNPHKEDFAVKIRPEKQGEVEYLDQHRHAKPKTTQANINRKKKNYVDKNSEISLDDVRTLIRMLSPHRSEGYHDWLHVGWCLHNIDHSLLSEWIEFSQLSEKYREGECEKVWDDARDEGFGISSLHRWARQDSPNEYENYWRDHLFSYIEQALSGTTFDVATVLHQMFRYRYVCAEYKHNVWYEFKNHRWREIDSAESLRARLSNEVLNEFCRLNVYYNQSAIGEKDAQKGQFIVKSDQLNAVSLKLRDVKFKDKVIDEARNLFYDRYFSEKLDQIADLIGFENGVYDLKLGEFRDGRPEDYVSMSTGNDYIEYDGKEPEILELYDFMSKVFPIERVRDYVFMLLSSFLLGSNPDQKFHIWTGCHAKDTPIMMADGQIKMVQDIQKGEQLMGDDSQPRNVHQLVRGYSDMYRITPVKGDFSYTVNGDHILCLMATTIGSVVWSEKEKRYKVSWQERNEMGYPKFSAKNFPIKHVDKKIYKKGLFYHDSKESAYQQAIEYFKNVKQQKNTIKYGDIIEIPVKEYLKIKKTIGERNYFAYRVPINFPEKDVDLDPYLLGYWLGDGSSDSSSITTMDKEIVKIFDMKTQEMGLVCRISDKKNNKSKTYHYNSGTNKGPRDRNQFLNCLKKYNLIKNKHIPNVYKFNSREVREKVLAGLIDSDGSYQKHSNQYEITLKSESLINDIIVLTRSLGFACYKKERIAVCTNGKDGPVKCTCYRIQIVGVGIENIPVILDRKKARPRIKKKDVLRYGFTIEKVEDDDYYGFTVDGNHRYLMGDHTVTHNCGSNGKSLLVSLFESSFGKYCAKLPISLLTQKRGASNSASPELSRTLGTRFVSLQEPDEHERMNIGLMKEITGGDKIQARPMYRAPIEFIPQFKMVLCCNHLPKVPPNDDGTWRRLRVVDFISKFVDDPDPTVPYHYKKDIHLSKRFPDWKSAFMYILLEHHKVYRDNGMKVVEPPEVKAATKEYQKISDVFVEFRDENLEQDHSGSIKLEESYSKFRIWFKANYDIKAPSRRDFKDNMEKHLGGKYNIRQGWGGWSFIAEEDDLDVFDGITENPIPNITPAEFRSSVVPPKTSQVTPVLTMQKSKTSSTQTKTPKLTVTPKLKKI